MRSHGETSEVPKEIAVAIPARPPNRKSGGMTFSIGSDPSNGQTSARRPARWAMNRIAEVPADRVTADTMSAMCRNRRMNTGRGLPWVPGHGTVHRARGPGNSSGARSSHQSLEPSEPREPEHTDD